MSFGLGGNPNINTGQIAMDTSSHPIPLPVARQNVAVPGMWMIHICAGAADVYVGDSTVTNTTGYRVPSNTSKDFYSGTQYYVVGASGTVTYMWEYA